VSISGARKVLCGLRTEQRKEQGFPLAMGSTIESVDCPATKEYRADGAGQRATSGGQGLVIEEPYTSRPADAQSPPAQKRRPHGIGYLRLDNTPVPASSGATQLAQRRISLDQNIETSVAPWRGFVIPRRALRTTGTSGYHASV